MASMEHGGVSQSQSSITKITARCMKSFRKLVPSTPKKGKRTSLNGQKRNLQNSQSAINQLPVEIFIKIISFAGRPSIKTPYPYVPYSWVCRYWRLAILNNVVFWKTIIVGPPGTLPIPLEEVLRRSQNAPLDIIIQRNELSEVFSLIQRFPTLSIRVKTFHWTIHWCLSSDSPPLSVLLPLFPSLENIFCYSSSGSPSVLGFLPPLIPPQLKAMQISVKHSIGNLADPGLFCKLRWLSLTYVYGLIPLISLLDALQNLPNLQFLHLFGSPQPNLDLETKTEDHKSIITLRELTVLITNCPIIHLIDAPKLSHLDVSAIYSAESSIQNTYDHLCGFDFSGITRIRSEMIRGSVDPSIAANPRYKWKDVDNVSWSGWSSFGNYRYNSGLKWIFDDDPTSYHPNQFHLSFGEHRTERPPALIPTFILYLTKATNLKEIILTRLDLSSLDHSDIQSLSKSLRGATSVRDLTILSSNSLRKFCNLLRDGNLIPNLERISYSASYDEKETDLSSIPNSLWKLVTGRFKTCPKPLEIELSNFPYLQPREFKQLTDCGFQFVRKESKLVVTAHPKKVKSVLLHNM